MSRSVRVGLLVFAGLALFFVALFAIANRSFLFSNTFFLESEFENVAGLQPGAAVQFQGVRVGRVETVQLPEEPGRPITVQMAIREDAQNLIHANTNALIKTDGLVGNQIIVLVNPPQLEAKVESGDTIPGVEPFDVYEITDQALAAVDTFATVAEEARQIMEDVQRGEGSMGRFIYDPALYDGLVATTEASQQAVRDVSRGADAIIASADEATTAVQSILAKIDEGDGTLARLLNDDEVYTSVLATADTLKNASDNIRAITSSAENAANWGALGAYRFSELMEAAKHNFIFKRYFEERGYMEKAPFEVRESAIEASFRELEQRQQELYEWEQRLKRQASQQEGDASESAATSTSSSGTSDASAPDASAPDASAPEDGEAANAQADPAGGRARGTSELRALPPAGLSPAGLSPPQPR